MTRVVVAFVLGVGLASLLLYSRAAAPVVEDGAISVYCSPKGGCGAAVVEQIAVAGKTLDIAAYAMTHKDIAAAVKKAKERGVKVRVLLDVSQATQEYSSATYLDNAGVDVRTWRGGGSMHHKSMLIDGKILICGSFNFTKAADIENAENLLIIRERPRIIRAFAEQFETLWIKSKKYEREKSD